MSLKIFVVTHKITDMPRIKHYYPLMVGSVMREEIPDDYCRDDSGDNISAYNDSYCELTGLYWIWKNESCEYTGLVHYRRFFARVRGLNIRQNYLVLSKKNAYRLLAAKDIRRELMEADLIVKKSCWRRRDNKTIFSQVIGADVIDNLSRSVSILYPDYMQSYNGYLAMHYHVNCNMFIGRKEIIDRYCQWLFDILQKADALHTEKCGERYHGRELGYLGELLFGVWLDYNNINYKFCDVINTEGTSPECNLLYPAEFAGMYCRVLAANAGTVLRRLGIGREKR